ncbi:2017_t:CDS:2 [Cetraspora pellucida]|uniref:2017_t:CDS:1 n=1 Tax=Cetraspora pellucida TaxID=1433469 RepID=A0A9N9CZM7_9GLOM|nr:2017_t:CDS:2 [Cetraspora pellucida]
MLKTYLQVSMDDLHVVYEKISLVLENQYQEIKTKSSQELIQIPQHLMQYPKIHYSLVVISLVHQWVYLVFTQFGSSLTLINIYSSTTFINTEPSKTEYSLNQKWEDYNQQFNSLSLYQKSVVLKRMSSTFQESTVIVQDPEVQSTRGCLVGAKNYFQSSTARDLSTFELIISRKCSICCEIGHNSRTCPNTESLDENSNNRKCGIYHKTRHNSRTCSSIKSSDESSKSLDESSEDS